MFFPTLWNNLCHSLSETDLVLSTHKIISVVFVIFCVLSNTLTAVMQIDDLAEVDYSLSSLPAVFQQFIDLDLKVVVS